MRILFLLIAGLAHAASGLVLNNITDAILVEVRAIVLAQGRDTIPVPDVSERKAGFQAECTGGWARSLSSLKRTGDVEITKTENSVTLKVALGLGNLELGFRRCKFHFLLLPIMDGEITAKVSSNSIAAQVTAALDDQTCSLKLDELKLAKVGGIELNTGRPGILRRIEDKVISLFANLIKGIAARSISNELEKTVREQLEQEDLCCKLPLKLALKLLPS